MVSTVGDAAQEADRASTHASDSNMILPPPAIRSIVDKTAAFVAKSPNASMFEDKIRAREKSDSRFAFLNASDAYHAYYQQRLEAFKRGEETDAPDGANSAADGTQASMQDAATVNGQNSADSAGSDGRPPEPPALEFLVEQPPSINAVDLDILRLTALFTARSGRKFTSELASRESRNYQFDFLRPSHSLFGYFNRQAVCCYLLSMREQYTKILIPSSQMLERLESRAGGPPQSTDVDKAVKGRRAVLKDAHVRADWDRWDSTKRQELADAEEAERIAFAEIDWQDFVVASTIEFTEGDEAGLVELPPPMSLSEVENMTLAQKKMAAMIMEGKEDEAQNSSDEGEMDLEEPEATVRQHGGNQSRQDVTTKVNGNGDGPIKIRKDYVPKAKRPAQQTQAYTEFGGQQVPVEEFAQHIRYELLDPRWKEEKRRSEANRSAANLLPEGTDVASSIRDLAAHRPDIFGGSANDQDIKRRQEELLAQSKAREAHVWDGHTATKEAVQSRYQANANFQEQIEALHRAKGLVGPDDGQEPKIGPAAPVTAEPSAPAEAISTFMRGATMSADPQPQSAAASISAPTGPMHHYPAPVPPPMASTQPMSFEAQPTESRGVVRPGAEPEEQRSFKRQRIEKREDGTLWPEDEWLASHPDEVTVKVQLPDYASKPSWGCDGSVLELEVPLTIQVGLLRDKIMSKRGLPVSKQKFTYNGKPLTNQPTLAGLNFESGDVIQVAVKEKR
ncbi:SF3a splicing factor complex subunit [Microbotryomycetes sp. JL221]|nr:SF3a splicing factor complex subunit [Microbotryomycetes sp. JL221]